MINMTKQMPHNFLWYIVNIYILSVEVYIQNPTTNEDVLIGVVADSLAKLSKNTFFLTLLM